MNDYLTTQQLLDELQRRLDYDADVSEQLASESNELQDRIDKAIEQINKSIYTYNGEGIYEVYDIPQIIAILKGSDSNE